MKIIILSVSFSILVISLFLSTAEAREVSPFDFQLDESAVDGKRYSYVDSGTPHAIIKQGQNVSLPVIILPATDKPVLVKFHATVDYNQTAPPRMPRGVHAVIEPSSVLVKPYQNTTINIVVNVDSNAHSGKYALNIVGEWNAENGFMGSSIMLHIGRDFGPNAIPYNALWSPLKQYESGIAAKNVRCDQDLLLVIKLEDGSPACVKLEDVTKLFERGWGPVDANAFPINIQKQISDSSKALKLYLSTSSQVIKPGQAIGITISVNNTSSNPIQMPAQNNWSYGNVSTGVCARIGYGVAVLDGYYAPDNLTLGKILPIFNPGVLCPFITEHAMTYEFQPSSGQVKEIQCDQTQNMQCNPNYYQMGYNYEFSGYWNYGNIEPFKSGIYTIVGADEWGHVSIEHLVVTNSTIFAGELGSMSCPVIYGGGVQISATIKNSTGFANYYNSTQYGNTFFLHPGMQGKINVQYNAPANAAWFQKNDNTSFNMTNGAALFYMANVTNGKTMTSYAVSSYDDEAGHHTMICNYFLPNGGFAEPCNTDNTGDIPPSEIPDASRVQHAGINTSFEPNSIMVYPNSNPVFTATISTNSNAMPGIYWISLERSLCGPGVLAKLVVLP